MSTTVFSYNFLVAQIGAFCVEEEEGFITSVSFSTKKDAPLHEQGKAPTSLLEKAATQLCAYGMGTLTTFSLPLNPKGSEFQKKVWLGLLSIPYGTTTSYGALAEAIGRPKAARAVGGANNKNPISVIIPCHRVIGANGGMVGYAGGIALKECLLAIESSHKKSTPLK